MNNLLCSTFCRKGLMLSFFILSFAVFARTSNAQCPTDIVPTVGQTGYVAWTDHLATPLTATLPGGCTITIYYCDRTCTNGYGYQSYIYKIVGNPANCEDGFGLLTLMDAATEAVINARYPFGNKPICDGELVFGTMTGIYPTCWNNTTNGTLHCNLTGAKCLKSFNYCWDENQFRWVNWNVNYTLLNGPIQCESGCIELPCGTQ